MTGATESVPEIAPASPLLSSTTGGATGSSIKGAIFNLANSTIGTGVLGLPFVLRICGLVLGVIILTLFGLLANFTLRLLHYDSILAQGRTTYEEVGLFALGKWGAGAVKLAIILINYGGIISYFIVIGDFLQPVAEDWFGTSQSDVVVRREFIIGIVAFLIVLPLCLPRKIKTLEYASFVSLALVFVFSVIVVVKAFMEGFQGHIRFFNIDIFILKVFGIVVFAFSCHTNLLPVAAELEYPTPARLGRAVHGSTVICYTTYLVVSLFGYLTFYSNTPGNLLLGYARRDVLIDVIRVVLALTIILTYPLTLYPARLSLDLLLFGDRLTTSGGAYSAVDRPAGESQRHSANTFDLNDSEAGRLVDSEHTQTQLQSGAPQSEDGHPLVHFMLCGKRITLFSRPVRMAVETVALVTTSYLIAIVVPSVEVVFSLVGSTASSCTSYVFPALFYLKLAHLDTDTTRGKTLRKIGAQIIVPLGIVFAVLATTLTIISLVS